jgi:hypothetical protein
MKRSWMRVIRRRGWLLLGVPLIVIGSLFLLLDHFFDEYLASLEASGDIDRRISQVEQMKAYQPRLLEVNQSLKPQYQEIETRSFKSTSSSSPIVQMESRIKSALQGLYFDEIAIKPIVSSTVVKGTEGLLLLEVDFVGVPQQLNRLESALAVNEYALRVNKLEVVAENNLVAGAGNIRVKSQFLALYLQPIIYPLAVNKTVPR